MFQQKMGPPPILCNTKFCTNVLATDMYLFTAIQTTLYVHSIKSTKVRKGAVLKLYMTSYFSYRFSWQSEGINCVDYLIAWCTRFIQLFYNILAVKLFPTNCVPLPVLFNKTFRNCNRKLWFGVIGVLRVYWKVLMWKRFW